MGCPRLTLKSRIKFAEEGGAAGITAVGVGEHQHVLQELEQGLDLLAFLDIIQPDYQLLQSLLLLFLFAALTGATGHVAAGGDCGKLGNLLLSELSCSTASAAGPALGPRPRPDGDGDRPCPASARPAQPHRAAGNSAGEKRKPPAYELRIATGRWERRTPPSWPLSGKRFLIRVPPIGRGVIFSPKKCSV